VRVAVSLDPYLSQVYGRTKEFGFGVLLSRPLDRTCHWFRGSVSLLSLTTRERESFRSSSSFTSSSLFHVSRISQVYGRTKEFGFGVLPIEAA